MLGDDDFNIWDDIFGAPDIDRDGDVDMMDAMLRDDMDEDVKRIFLTPIRCIRTKTHFLKTRKRTISAAFCTTRTTTA